ncbi:peptide MFS transporter [Sphingomonas sp. ASV193]|uniref:peptide MFS transporter n=1 Tax=Sphingomonas sp. ASV193 TaxID=3144405 RepID=UPI0032E8C350
MSAADGTQKGHPRGLAVLAGTELAERFSFYGMKALLVLYMVHQLLLPGTAEQVIGLGALRRLLDYRGGMSDQAFASLIYGWYSGLVYFTPLIGGWVADRLLGARRTVMLGALLMVAGHLLMSFAATFLVALLLLILGSGCLKGNISAQVGPLYPPEAESRRARGFTIFSTGINVGATAGPLVTGALAQAYGWHAGFACAAVLMVVALVVYATGQKHLRGKEVIAEESADAPLTGGERQRVWALLFLILVNVPIAMAYYQLSNVGVVWVEQAGDLATPLGDVPAAWFNSIDSFASILVAPVLIALWARQARAGREPDSLMKVTIGALINTAAPLVLVAGIAAAGGGKVGVGWLVGAWFLGGLAFMYYWPLTLELIASRAPAKLRSTLMGGCFLSLFAGNVLLGYVGSTFDRMSPATFWALDAAIGLVAVAMMIVAIRPMRRVLG